MANDENLVMITSTSRARELGRKGGIATGKKKRELRTMREVANIILSLTVKKGKKTDETLLASVQDIAGKNLDVNTAIIVKQMEKALKGDLKATEFLRDITGQKPKDTVEVVNETAVDQGRDFIFKVREALKDDSK